MVFVLISGLGEIIPVDVAKLIKSTKPYKTRRRELSVNMMVVKMRENMEQCKLNISAITLLY